MLAQIVRAKEADSFDGEHHKQMSAVQESMIWIDIPNAWTLQH
jgi:hypothetical protein